MVEKIYSLHHSWLSSWLTQRTGCDQLAADLAQDTFVKLLKKNHIDEQHNSRAFLKTVANGLWIDHWRHRKIEEAWFERLKDLPEPATPSAEQSYLILETLYQIDSMLSKLPEKVATAFILSQVEGLKYRDIAVKLGVSERMVKKYMAKAMLECTLIEAQLPVFD